MLYAGVFAGGHGGVYTWHVCGALPLRVCVLTHACVCLSRACVWHSVNLPFEQQWGSKVCAAVGGLRFVRRSFIHHLSVLLFCGLVWGVSTVWEGGEGEEHCLLGASDSDSDAFEQWFILFCV